jgi:hypothetical protein
MTNAVKERSIFDVPLMTEEGTPELELPTTPIRVSGFAALFFGLCSFAAVLGETLIIVPLLSLAIAFYAVRPYAGERPVGVIAGWIAILCASLFAVWGLSERHFKSRQLGEQATRFAYEWLTLVGQGDMELAAELQLDPSLRQPPSMALADYYKRSPNAASLMKQLLEQDAISRLIKAGTKPKWELDRPTRTYTMFGREMTETIWKDTTGTFPNLLRVSMEYIHRKDQKQASWKVEMVGDYLETLVAS